MASSSLACADRQFCEFAHTGVPRSAFTDWPVNHRQHQADCQPSRTLYLLHDLYRQPTATAPHHGGEERDLLNLPAQGFAISNARSLNGPPKIDSFFVWRNKMQRHLKPIQNRVVFLGAAFALVLVMGTRPTIAQDNGKQDTTVQENDDQAKQAAFAKKFWDYLQEADYQEKWSRWPGHEEEFIEGTAPHGAFLKVYINDKVTGNVENPPAKSIIVKENYNEQKELVAITPMYRVGEDYAPDNNDWYWAKYKPDGTLFEMNNMKVSGRVKGCIECHKSAKGDDYLFSNDK